MHQVSLGTWDALPGTVSIFMISVKSPFAHLQYISLKNGFNFHKFGVRNIYDFSKNLLLLSSPWPNDQTLLVQLFKFALQQMFDCLTMSRKHCLTSKSDKLCIMMKKFKNIFCLMQAKNVGQATFLDVVKLSNILPDKQISNV